jgi:hypothetical protein
MKPRELAIRTFAEAMSMTVASAKEYVRKYEAEFGRSPAWIEHTESMAAQGEDALLEAARSIDETDLADVASDPDLAYDDIIGTQAERTLRARFAAHASWANTEDRAARTRKARDAFEKRFENQVDPDRTLPPDERARRAEHAKKAHFLRMAYKSAQARKAGSR